MKFRGTLSLGLVLVLLCLTYGAMRHYERRELRRVTDAKRVFDFEPEAIRSLRIQRIGEDATAAVRGDDGRWSVTEPNPSIVAFQMLWDRVVTHLAQLTNERSIGGPVEDLAAYGLDAPMLQLSFNAAGDQPAELTFGALEPTQRFQYAQLDGAGVFLVKKESFFELNRPLKDLRHQFLVNDRESPLVRIEFARVWTGRGPEEMENPPEIGEESVAVVVARDGADAPWRLIEPVEAAAGAEAADVLAAEIQYAVGKDHVDSPEDLGDYGLDPPAYRITVSDAATGTPQTIYLGGLDQVEEAGGIFVKRKDRDAVCLIDAHLLAVLPQTPDALRDRRLFTGRVTDIQEFRYRSRTGEFVLEKNSEGTWQLASPETASTDQGRVSLFLSGLKAVLLARFSPGTAEEYGLDDPDVTMTFTFANGAEPATIHLREDESKDFFHATQDTGAVGVLYSNYAEAFLVGPDEFRSRELMRFVNQNTVRLEFQLEGAGYVFEKHHGRWLVTAPEDKKLSNQSDVDMLLDAVNPLIAVAVEQQETRDLQPYGLDSPVFTLYVTTKGPLEGTVPERIGPLKIGAVAPDDSQLRFAMAEGRPGVFRVKQKTIDRIREALRGLRDP